MPRFNISPLKMMTIVCGFLWHIFALILTAIASIFVFKPKAVRMSKDSVALFKHCCQNILDSGNPTKYAVTRLNKTTKVSKLLEDVKKMLRLRCRQYILGPLGWSGDDSIRQCCDTDYVGLRWDLLKVKENVTAQFTVRHELQHEIQHNLGVRSAQCFVIVPRIGRFQFGIIKRRRRIFGHEMEANTAASLYVMKFCKTRSWHMHRTRIFCVLLSLACTLGFLERIGVYIVILIILITVFRFYPQPAPYANVAIVLLLLTRVPLIRKACT